MGRRDWRRVCWRRGLQQPLLLLPSPLGVLTGPAPGTPHFSRPLSLSLQLAPPEKKRDRQSAREARQQSAERAVLARSPFPGIPSIPYPLLLISIRTFGLPDPKEPPPCPATELKGPRHLASAGNLHVICIHLHTPHSRGLQSKDVK